MDIKPIKTSGGYADVLQEISVLMVADPALDTPEGDQLDVLISLVKAYEAKQFQIEPPDATAPLVTRNGVVLLPMGLDAQAVTLARVNQLRDELP